MTRRSVIVAMLFRPLNNEDLQLALDWNLIVSDRIAIWVSKSSIKIFKRIVVNRNFDNSTRKRRSFRSEETIRIRLRRGTATAPSPPCKVTVNVAIGDATNFWGIRAEVSATLSLLYSTQCTPLTALIPSHEINKSENITYQKEKDTHFSLSMRLKHMN